jgi:WD repeat-containing protein 23
VQAVSAARLLNLLASNGLRHILHYNGWRGGTLGDEDEDDDEFGFLRYSRRSRRSGAENLPKVPSDEGTELMRSGDFGEDPYFVDMLKKRKKTLAAKIMWRELGVDVSGRHRLAVQSTAQVSSRPRAMGKELCTNCVGLSGPDTWFRRRQDHSL